MILVLTYHRIVENAGAIKGFFDVTADELDNQLRLVMETWGKCASPADFFELPDRSDGEGRRFLITFDDGTEDHFTNAAPVLERHGVRGIFFVSTSRLGKDGYLTAPQCQALHDAGHAVESHSHEHKKLTGLLDDDLRHQLAESRRVLRELCLGQWDFLAVPGGYFSASVIEAARTAGYRFLRTLEWGYNRTPAPLRLASITVNRKTARRWFAPLISPRFEAAKKVVYRAKESVKTGRLRSLYFALRSPRTKTPGALQPVAKHE